MFPVISPQPCLEYYNRPGDKSSGWCATEKFNEYFYLYFAILVLNLEDQKYFNLIPPGRK